MPSLQKHHSRGQAEVAHKLLGQLAVWIKTRFTPNPQCPQIVFIKCSGC